MASVEFDNLSATPKSGFFAKIAALFVNMMESNSRAQKLAYLTNMTDEQLAAKGIKREDIVRHVVADVLYI